MGEIAEMVVEGILCETCGVLLDSEAPGYPRRCLDCKRYDRKHAKRDRQRTPIVTPEEHHEEA